MGDAAGVFPETLPLIYHARCLPDRPWEQRLTPYANLGVLLTERAEAHPEKPWLLFHDEERRAETITYDDFRRRAQTVASMMADPLGLQTGDRIAVLIGNDPRTVLIYFGAWLLGATVVPLNMTEDDDRISYILQNAEVRCLFALPEQAERGLRLAVPGVRDIVQIGGAPIESCRDFERLLAEAGPLNPPPDLSPDTEALIIYTSGTTGPPKGVVLDHANLLADAHSIAKWHRFGPEDRAMNVLPIHHVNGIVVTLVAPLYSGGSVVLNRRFHARTFWRTLAEEGCTWVSVVPTILAFLCEQGETLDAYDLSRFRHIICGAGPLTVELARRFHQTFGVRVIHGYGLSETTCYSCFLPIDLSDADYLHWLTECGFPSIGCPISANVMEIHDAQGVPQPPGVRGEIVARGHNVMRCYFQRPEANRDTFAHGWFRSGDEGFYEVGADGLPYFFITGRLKELIIRGGINYSPFDIDEVLNAIPGVRAAMAVGFDNDVYGEEIGAYVQLAEGAAVTEAEILSACRAHLPFSKSPKVVIFGDTFPVTSTGKYQRGKLKPLFAAWKSTQFREERK